MRMRVGGGKEGRGVGLVWFGELSVLCWRRVCKWVERMTGTIVNEMSIFAYQQSIASA